MEFAAPRLAIRRRRGGFSLVEIAMVLAVVSLMVAAALLFFSNASASRKRTELVQQIGAVQAAVAQLYQSQPGYDGLSAAVLANSGLMPRKWVRGVPPNATGLATPQGGVLDVYPDPLQPENYDIRVTGLSGQDCQHVAMLQLGSNMFGVVANEATYAAQGMSITQAATYCYVNNNVVRWALYK